MIEEAPKLTDKQLSKLMKKVEHHGFSTDLCWSWRGGHNTDAQGVRRPTTQIGGKKYYIHRLLYLLVRGAIPTGNVVRHRCDNPLCCSPYHTELGTTLDNMRDMVERDRKGQLANEVVATIKRKLRDGLTHAEVAAQYGVSRQLITDINTGKAYAHVTLEADNEQG